MIIQIPEEPLILQTRTGRTVQFERGLRIARQDLVRANRFVVDKFPEALRSSLRKEPTGMYNCHGLTFTSRRGFLGNEQNINLILEDDDYYYVEQADICAGDIILYYQNGELEHSGIVTTVPQGEIIFNPWILSKWGNGGEYIHRYDYCPYNWQNVRFMREGRND